MDEQLNALDATFLELEEADQGAHMHIGGVMVFEPRPDGRAPSVSEVVARLEQGLEQLPRYRDRLSSPTTGGFSWPFWREDERFRVANHVRAVSLPPPGGQAELLEWAGEFYSERLDRAQPLWEMVVVEGLAGGRWALANKTHHCMVDGIGSVDTIQLVLDTEPQPAAASQPASSRFERPPGTGAAFAAAVVDRSGDRLGAASGPCRQGPGQDREGRSRTDRRRARRRSAPRARRRGAEALAGACRRDRAGRACGGPAHQPQRPDWGQAPLRRRLGAAGSAEGDQAVDGRHRQRRRPGDRRRRAAPAADRARRTSPRARAARDGAREPARCR